MATRINKGGATGTPAKRTDYKAQLDAFKLQVRDLISNAAANGDICTSGANDALIELGLDTLKTPYNITYNVTVNATNFLCDVDRWGGPMDSDLQTAIHNAVDKALTGIKIDGQPDLDLTVDDTEQYEVVEA